MRNERAVGAAGAGLRLDPAEATRLRAAEGTAQPIAEVRVCQSRGVPHPSRSNPRSTAATASDPHKFMQYPPLQVVPWGHTEPLPQLSRQRCETLSAGVSGTVTHAGVTLDASVPEPGQVMIGPACPAHTAVHTPREHSPL